ncbi:MAG: phospholipase D-like domain-containing protein [Chloroflexi bacterium]|nr:phospholipase D-like domain-containing protein [Chloroflexota bacterium]
MPEITIHPNVYSTSAFKSLRYMLENIWVRDHKPGEGIFYIVSGFANFNGGARFYRVFREHIDQGGKLVAFLGGSTSQKLSSRQVVEALLECGAEVNVVNRKRILHAKCYGVESADKSKLIVTSGNFTGPGMSQNIESSVLLNENDIEQSQFNWTDLISSFRSQNWMTYTINDPSDLNNPIWQLLYDERVTGDVIDESDEVTLILILGHSDTARIQAAPSTKASKGTQYFWLSKDSFDFFPPLTIRNQRGIKGTLSALVTLHYVDIQETDTQCRVTFEAENNLDFRLGTGRLRNTNLAKQGDIACISRIGDAEYKLRIIRQSNPLHRELGKYAVHLIGHQGKRYGYIDNPDFENKLGIRLSASPYS